MPFPESVRSPDDPKLEFATRIIDALFPGTIQITKEEEDIRLRAAGFANLDALFAHYDAASAKVAGAAHSSAVFLPAAPLDVARSEPRQRADPIERTPVNRVSVVLAIIENYFQAKAQAHTVEIEKSVVVPKRAPYYKISIEFADKSRVLLVNDSGKYASVIIDPLNLPTSITLEELLLLDVPTVTTFTEANPQCCARLVHRGAWATRLIGYFEQDLSADLVERIEAVPQIDGSFEDAEGVRWASPSGIGRIYKLATETVEAILRNNSGDISFGTGSHVTSTWYSLADFERTPELQDVIARTVVSGDVEFTAYQGIRYLMLPALEKRGFSIKIIAMIRRRILGETTQAQEFYYIDAEFGKRKRMKGMSEEQLLADPEYQRYERSLKNSTQPDATAGFYFVDGILFGGVKDCARRLSGSSDKKTLDSYMAAIKGRLKQHPLLTVDIMSRNGAIEGYGYEQVQALMADYPPLMEDNFRIDE